MTEIGVEFDPIWEEFYSAGQQLNKYPFNHVPNFFFRHRPRDKKLSDVTVMEVGFGAGNNLWMCAREGANVCGVDAAESGVKFAKERFAAEGLSGDLRLGDFTKLPFDDNSVDMVINRQALTQVSHSRSKVAVAEILRCLKPGGVFWNNMFSDTTYKEGDFLGDGLWGNITAGKLAGVGQTAFHNKDELLAMYADGWEIVELEHVEYQNMSSDQIEPYSEWMVVSRKI